jgi:hypothetical protein
MALRTRVWSAGKLLLLGGGLLLTYILFAAAGMRIALKTREVAVPELQGRSVNEASALLAEADLNLHVEEGRRIDPKVPVGHILTQEPQAGVSTRRDRNVRVWVSAGPRSTVVPALVGESERAAKIRSSRKAWKRRGAEIRSSDSVTRAARSSRRCQAEGPASGRPVGEPRRARETYVMPDLIGVNGDRAPTLRATGFRIAVVGDHPHRRASPQAGFGSRAARPSRSGEPVRC